MPAIPVLTDISIPVRLLAPRVGEISPLSATVTSTSQQPRKSLGQGRAARTPRRPSVRVAYVKQGRELMVAVAAGYDIELLCSNWNGVSRDTVELGV